MNTDKHFANLKLIEKLVYALDFSTTQVIRYFQTGGKGVEEKSPKEIVDNINKNRKE